jgi:hypothetical protein
MGAVGSLDGLKRNCRDAMACGSWCRKSRRGKAMCHVGLPEKSATKTMANALSVESVLRGWVLKEHQNREYRSLWFLSSYKTEGSHVL